MSTDSLPQWDLSNVFPGLDSEELTQAMDRLRVQIEDMDRYLESGKIAKDGHIPASSAEAGEVVAGYLDRMNALLTLATTLNYYVYAFVATDSYSEPARRLLSEVEPLLVRIERHEVLFRGWIGSLSKSAVDMDAVLNLPGTVHEHAFYLVETAERSRFLMSAAEETLAAELSLSGARAWQRLQEVTCSQIRVPFVLDGKEQELPMTVLQNLRTHEDADVRKRAYEAELAAWDSVREPLAACLNGVKGAVDTLNRRRGRSDALDEPLEQSRIERQTLEAMLDAMGASLPAFRRYFRSKAKHLGREALPWWDLSSPVGEVERRFAFAEARGLVLEQFGAFSERMQAFAERAFENQWIDAEPRDGKTGGAFCMPIPTASESRILCNFDGSMGEVLTLAHELGHGYHNECLVGRTALQLRTPMTLNETASNFCETIIRESLLGRAQSDSEELAILESFLVNASQVVVDIYSRYLFEKEVFVRRSGAELSASELCDIMLGAQRQTYGDGLDPRFMNSYMWAWKPHYYIPDLSFYNFPYTFGLLFSLGLYAIYQERGIDFVSDYDDLLSSTGEVLPSDLARRFGFDISLPAFWKASLGLIEERITRYAAL